MIAGVSRIAFFTVPGIAVYDELNDVVSVQMPVQVATGIRLVFSIAHYRLDNGSVIQLKVNQVTNSAKCCRASDDLAVANSSKPLVVVVFIKIM